MITVSSYQRSRITVKKFLYICAAAVTAALLTWMSYPSVTARAESLSGTEDIIEIATPDQLVDIRRAPSAHYRLTADLDMGETNWLPLPFTGIFDGDGHTLYNLRVLQTGHEVRTTADGNLKPYDTTFAGLFSTVENAAVSNLHLTGAEISVQNDGSCFAALLAGYVRNSTFSGCSVEGCVNMISKGVNVGVGGLAGYGTSDFDGCRADATLFFEDRRTGSRCEQFMGGLLASGTGHFTDCMIRIDGYDSCHGYVHNGGLTGMYFNGEPDWRAGRVNRNFVEGQISFFEDNPDRRAYCAAYIGERLDPPIEMTDNSQQFTRNESTDYTTVLRPEKCDEPQYRVGVTPPTCTEWGYTTYLCQACGHTWRESFTPPRHIKPHWETVIPPTTSKEGLRRQTCTACGALLAEETLPPLPEKSSGIRNNLPIAIWLSPAAVLLATGGLLIFRKKRLRKPASQK